MTTAGTAIFGRERLAENIMHFARVLRVAGLPVGPAKVIAALEAVEAVGVPPRLLPSGAGHDTMAMGKLCPAGMLFVRCKGGVSHNPLESITVEDCALGLAALSRFVRDFKLG